MIQGNHPDHQPVEGGYRGGVSAPAPTTPYQLLGAQGGRLVTLRSFWARDDDHARELAGELPPGVLLLFREVDRASPGKGGRI